MSSKTTWIITLLVFTGGAAFAGYYYFKKKECEAKGGTWKGLRCEYPEGGGAPAPTPTPTPPGPGRTCPTPPSPTLIRPYFEALGCTVDYIATTPRQVKVSYGGKSYTFVEGVDCRYVEKDRLGTDPSKALEVARYLGACS